MAEDDYDDDYYTVDVGVDVSVSQSFRRIRSDGNLPQLVEVNHKCLPVIRGNLIVLV